MAELRKLIGKLGTKLAPATVVAITNEMSSLFRFALKERLIAHNPVRDLDRDDRPPLPLCHSYRHWSGS